MKTSLSLLALIFAFACTDPKTPTPTLKPNITKGDTSSYYFVNGVKKLAILEKETFEGNQLLSIRDVKSSSDFTSFTIILKTIPNTQSSFPITYTTTKITDANAYISYQITKDGTTTIYNTDSNFKPMLFLEKDSQNRKVFTIKPQQFRNYLNNFIDTVNISGKLVLLENL